MAKRALQDRPRREAQLAEIREIQRGLEERAEARLARVRRKELLQSVTLGLYVEIDKLCKKVPVEEATDLVVQQVNDLIADVKSLVDDDPFVERMTPFVPAGNNPQHRDVIIVLQNIKQALLRLGSSLEKDTRNASLAREAALVETALSWHLDGGALTQDDESVTSADDGWFDDSGEFDFAELDQTNLREYFGLE